MLNSHPNPRKKKKKNPPNLKPYRHATELRHSSFNAKALTLEGSYFFVDARHQDQEM